MGSLRARTAALHEATEQLPLMRRLLAADVDSATYRHYLEALAGPYRWLEPALYQACSPRTLERLGVRPKLPALERDLAALGGEPATVPVVAVPIIATEGQALGGLYVLEGATLGGRVISARLRGHLGAAAQRLSFAFLGNDGDPSPAEHWRHFGRALDAEVSERGHDPERVLSAALAVFAFVHQALERQGCDQQL